MAGKSYIKIGSTNWDRIKKMLKLILAGKRYLIQQVIDHLFLAMIFQK
jgi:hypothetical protein